MRHTLLFLVLTAAACSAPPEEVVNLPPTVTLEGESAREVELGASVTVAATGADPEGVAVTYAWKVAKAPDGSEPSLTGAAAAQLTFTPDVEGVFQLEVRTSDGVHDSAPAKVTVTAVKQPFIDGALTVTVVDYDTGEPLEGVTVTAGELSTTTDAQGQAKFEDEALVAPVTLVVTSDETVEFDHDLRDLTDPVTRPAWRGVTIQGARLEVLTVPLRRSGSAVRVAEQGTVKGIVGDEIWLDQALWGEDPAKPDVIPLTNLAPMLSFDPGTLTSGQLRAVLIAPVAKKPVSELAVSDLMGRPAALGANLPANLTTNDSFLNSFASAMGVPAVPGGGDRLVHFQVDAPAGKQLFYAMGALVTVNTDALVPLIAGGNVDPASLFGSMEFTVLFVGLVEFDVPAGGVLELESGLTADSFKELWRTEATLATVESTGPNPFDPTLESDFERVTVTPTRVATVNAPAPLADPRVAASLPEEVSVELKNADGSSQEPPVFEQLAVPDDTTVPATDVPFAFTIAAVAAPGGVVPIGLGFTRVGDLALPASRFALPTVGGDWAGAPIQAVTLSTRGIVARGDKSAYTLLPGVSVQVSELSAGATVAPGTLSALPSVTVPEDTGLELSLDLERADETTAEVQSARAFVSDFDDPRSWKQGLTAAPAPAVADGTDLVHAVYSARQHVFIDPDGDNLGLNAHLVYPQWDVYVAAAEAASLALPPAELAPFAASDQLLLEVRAEKFGAAMDMERWNGERLRQGPRSFASDTWIAYWE